MRAEFASAERVLCVVLPAEGDEAIEQHREQALAHRAACQLAAHEDRCMTLPCASVAGMIGVTPSRRFAAGDEHIMADRPPTYVHRIIHDPAVLAGKPVIRGTRIPVEVILEYLAHNPDFGELFADYPRLTMDDVKASLEYAQRLVRIEATPAPR